MAIRKIKVTPPAIVSKKKALEERENLCLRLRGEAVILMKEGNSPTYIAHQLKEISKNQISAHEIDELITASTNLLKKEYLITPRLVRLQHVKQYHINLKRLLSIKELNEFDIGKTITKRQWDNSRKNKITANLEALDTMRQMQDLLGITITQVAVEINNQIALSGNSHFHSATTADYDFSKLGINELVRLLEIIDKTIVKDREQPISVIEVANTEKIITEEVVAEVMPATNIDFIKKIAPTPSPEQKPQGKSSDDVLQVLKNKLAQVAAKKYGNHGANLTEKERGLANDE